MTSEKVYPIVPDWIHENYRLLHLDAHFGEFKKIYAEFDADETARVIDEAGFQLVSYMAMDGPSYYPTDIGRRHAGLERDFVEEFTTALKKRGIRCLVYLSYGWGFDRDGLEREGLAQLHEILERYDIDGFFLDGPTQPFMRPHGYNDKCRALYREETGKELPKGDDDPDAFAFRRWANRHMEAYLEQTCCSLAAVKRDVVVFYNGAWMFRYPVNPPSYYRFVEWDTAVPEEGLYSSNYSLEGRYLSTVPGIAWSCMEIDAFSWGDYSLREREAFLHENALLLAAGGRTYLSDNPYPSGNMEPNLMQIFGEVNRRTEALEPWLKGCQPVKDVAVLHSGEAIWSRTPYDPIPGWRPGPAYQPIVGAHKTLTEGHVQMSIVNSQTFCESLGEYRAAVLANQRILDEKHCETIRRFVEQGGVIFATHETGTRDTDNQILPDFALADLFGIRRRGTMETSYSYLRKPANDAGIPTVDVQTKGGYTQFETTSAKLLLELVPPFEGIRTGTPPPAVDPEGPGVTINSFGKGKAIYCCSDIFEAYAWENTAILRKVALWILAQGYPEASRTILCDGAPGRVEMFLNERQGERFVHLVNYCTDKREYGTPYAQDFTAVHDIRLRLPLGAPPATLTIVPEGTAVPFDYEDGVLSFAAAPLLIHDVYRIQL